MGVRRVAPGAAPSGLRRLDDLTSALDVDTETDLWDRLAAAGITVLAASNRPVARERADRIVELRGR
ncbi:MAG: hypothetical protein ACK5PP_02440 [Acidimicrobiales bacterium]